tara:strand:- start:3101 stop:3958 length:858 start_codon:yes stop_codon:yes gene_type:complete
MAKKKAHRAPSKKKTPARRRAVKAPAPEQNSARILNCIPSLNTQDDWKYETALSSGIAAAAPIPSSKDLREPWWKIGDQGNTGSCVGWATADSILRWHFVQSGKINDNELISTRFTWMASKETDIFTSRPTTFIEQDGTSLKAALDISRKFGAVRDSILPFGSGQLYQGESDTFYAIASQLKIASYINLERNTQDWREWIANSGPILVRLDVDETWMNATATNGKLAEYKPETARGGHAVALVGYTANTFIVRNSWNTSWGDNGFAHASNLYAQAAFTEAYGVKI